MAFNTKLLDGMVIFVEVINAGSFTKAAEVIGHSTSYISKEITKLEARLGIRLLNRTTRSISLTPEGELYYQQCQQIIDDAEQAEASVNQRQLEPKGTLKVSCPVSFGFSHLREVFSNFLLAYPKVNLELNMSGKNVDLVSDGYDVVIRATGELEDSSFIAKKLFSSYGVTIASPNYLKIHGTPTHPDELINHHTISYSYINNPSLWQYQTQLGKTISVQLDCRVVTNNPEMEIDLALKGHGITRMPKFYLHDLIAQGRLVRLFEDYRTVPINVFLVYASRKHMAAKVRSFIDFVSEELGDKI